MSSLVRRSLRTTAAAAGIAVVGVGLAGTAVAAPGLPAAPDAQAPDAGALEFDETFDFASPAPAAPDSTDVPAAPTTPAADGVVIPGVVNFEMPTVNTAARALPAGDAFALPAAAPAAAPAPAAPAAPGTDFFDADAGEFSPESFAPVAEGENSVGAMQALDMATLATEMAQAAAAGDSITENQQIG